MSIYLGRRLEKDDHIDHIDGDRTNDDLENLQVLSTPEHVAKTIEDLKSRNNHSGMV